MTDEREAEFEAMKVELAHYKVWVQGLTSGYTDLETQMTQAKVAADRAQRRLDKIQAILDERWS